MEKYFRYTRCTHENDIETYHDALMVADMTPEGPKKGQRFAHVYYYTIMKVVVFDEDNKKSFVMIGIDANGKPFFLFK